MGKHKDRPGGSALKTPSKKLTLREEQKTLTRKRIVDAAMTVFEQKGYARATVEDILTAAEISRATFYQHFRNQADIATALFNDMVPENAQAFAELDLAIQSGSRQQVRDWVWGALEWWKQNQGAVLVLEQIVANGGFGNGGLEMAQSEAMPTYMETWKAAPDEARMRVYLMTTLITRTHRAWRMDGLFSSLSEEQVLDILTDLWISGLRMEGPPTV